MARRKRRKYYYRRNDPDPGRRRRKGVRRRRRRNPEMLFNPKRYRRRRYRRNPPPVGTIASDVLWATVGFVGTTWASPWVSGLLGTQTQGSMVGLALEAGVAYLVGWLGEMLFGARVGEQMLTGGMMKPAISLVSTLGVTGSPSIGEYFMGEVDSFGKTTIPYTFRGDMIESPFEEKEPPVTYFEDLPERLQSPYAM